MPEKGVPSVFLRIMKCALLLLVDGTICSDQRPGYDISERGAPAGGFLMSPQVAK